MTSSRAVLIFLFASVALALVSASKNDLVVGYPQYDSRVFVNEKVHAPAKLWGGKVVIEKEYRSPHIRFITMIRAFDQNSSGHGAHVAIVGGGIGFDYVKLRFKSERLRGVDFNVEVHGK